MIGGEDDAQLIAYDSAGEVVGSIGLWADPDGRLYLTADYEDGYAETVITDSRVRTEATLALEVIARRTEAMLHEFDYNGPDSGSQEGAQPQMPLQSIPVPPLRCCAPSPLAARRANASP